MIRLELLCMTSNRKHNNPVDSYQHVHEVIGLQVHFSSDANVSDTSIYPLTVQITQPLHQSLCGTDGQQVRQGLAHPQSSMFSLWPMWLSSDITFLDRYVVCNLSVVFRFFDLYVLENIDFMLVCRFKQKEFYKTIKPKSVQKYLEKTLYIIV